MLTATCSMLLLLRDTQPCAVRSAPLYLADVRACSVTSLRVGRGTRFGGKREEGPAGTRAATRRRQRAMHGRRAKAIESGRLRKLLWIGILSAGHTMHAQHTGARSNAVATHSNVVWLFLTALAAGGRTPGSSSGSLTTW